MSLGTTRTPTPRPIATRRDTVVARPVRLADVGADVAMDKGKGKGKAVAGRSATALSNVAEVPQVEPTINVPQIEDHPRRPRKRSHSQSESTSSAADGDQETDDDAASSTKRRRNTLTPRDVSGVRGTGVGQLTSATPREAGVPGSAASTIVDQSSLAAQSSPDIASLAISGTPEQSEMVAIQQALEASREAARLEASRQVALMAPGAGSSSTAANVEDQHSTPLIDETRSKDVVMRSPAASPEPSDRTGAPVVANEEPGSRRDDASPHSPAHSTTSDMQLSSPLSGPGECFSYESAEYTLVRR